jgi:hypothetical protein
MRDGVRAALRQDVLRHGRRGHQDRGAAPRRPSPASFAVSQRRTASRKEDYSSTSIPAKRALLYGRVRSLHFARCPPKCTGGRMFTGAVGTWCQAGAKPARRIISAGQKCGRTLRQKSALERSRAERGAAPRARHSVQAGQATTWILMSPPSNMPPYHPACAGRAAVPALQRRASNALCRDYRRP